MALFGSWLQDTRELQIQSYGKDPVGLDLQEWLTYVREQTLAAFVELGEYIQNITWKPWAKTSRFPEGEEVADAVEELVDVLHFVANNLVALGVTDDVLSEIYQSKMDINRDRMARGGH